MSAQQETFLCRYYYDPLDRVASFAPLNQPDAQRFYRKERLATEIQGQVQRSMLEYEEQPLAQQQRQAGVVASLLLATDLQRSILQSSSTGQHQQPGYSPYGYRSPESGLLSLLGFTGQRRDPLTGHYLLGNGYRAFNPVLMRFNSPDSLSPFGKGGVNAYAYCLGDPINLVDPKGEFALFIRGVNRLLSMSISAGQQARKGLKVLHGRISPKGKKLANELFDEKELRDLGAKFRQARKAAEPPPIAKFAKSKGYSEQAMFAEDGYKNFPEVQKRYAQSQKPEVVERYRQADVNLLVATGNHIKKYPDNESSTRKLVDLIRSQ